MQLAAAMPTIPSPSHHLRRSRLGTDGATGGSGSGGDVLGETGGVPVGIDDI